MPCHGVGCLVCPPTPSRTLLPDLTLGLLEAVHKRVPHLPSARRSAKSPSSCDAWRADGQRACCLHGAACVACVQLELAPFPKY